MRSGGRVVEGARLESEYTSKAYRGFESLPLRHPFGEVPEIKGKLSRCGMPPNKPAYIPNLVSNLGPVANLPCGGFVRTGLSKPVQCLHSPDNEGLVVRRRIDAFPEAQRQRPQDGK